MRPSSQRKPCLRVQVSVDAAPALWWQHAARCVLAEREELLNRRTLAAHPPAQRGSLRAAHARLYAAAQGRWGVGSARRKLQVRSAGWFRWRLLDAT